MNLFINLFGTFVKWFNILGNYYSYCDLCVMFFCLFVTFPYGVRAQMWDWILSIPDLCPLPFFVAEILDFAAVNNKRVNECI